jgi:hypothetical protein
VGGDALGALRGIPREEYPVVLRLLKGAIDARASKLSEELSVAAREIERFESKYQMTYADFREAYLAEHDEEHKDAIEWCYRQEAYQRTRALLEAYQRVQIEVKTDVVPKTKTYADRLMGLHGDLWQGVYPGPYAREERRSWEGWDPTMNRPDSSEVSGKCKRDWLVSESWTWWYRQ